MEKAKKMQEEYARKLYQNPKNLNLINKMAGYHDLDSSSPIKQNTVKAQVNAGVTPQERPQGYIPMPTKEYSASPSYKNTTIDPNKGYTAEELDQMESSVTPSSSFDPNKGYTAEELDQMESGTTSLSSTTPQGKDVQYGEMNPFLDKFSNALSESGNARDNNVQKGYGSGKDGRRTLGEINQNMSNLGTDIGTGLLKSVLQTGTGLAQLVSLGNRKLNQAIGRDGIVNSLDSKNPNMQKFQESVKGNSGVEKVSKTIGDVATIFAPGGPVSKAGNFTEKAVTSIPKVSKLMEGAGASGKLARYGTNLAKNLAEGVTTNVTLQDSPGEGLGWDVGISLLSPIASKLVRGAARKTGFLSSYGDELIKKFNAGDSDAIGQYNASHEGLRNMVREVFDNIPEASKNERDIINNLRKFDGLEGDEFYDFFVKNGGFDGVQSNSKFKTADVKERSKLMRDEVGKNLEEYLSSVPDKVDVPIDEIGKYININQLDNLRNITDGTYLTDIVNKVKRGESLSTKEAFELTKSLGSEAYNQGIKKETAIAGAYRNIRNLIKDRMLSTTGIDTQLAGELYDTYSKYAGYEKILDVLSKTKVPEFMNAHFFGKLMGAVTAVGAPLDGGMSYLLSIMADKTASQFVKNLNNININKLNEKWFKELNQAKSFEEVNKLLERAKEGTLSNIAKSQAADAVQKNTQSKTEKANKVFKYIIEQMRQAQGKSTSADFQMGGKYKSPKDTSVPSIQLKDLQSPNAYADPNVVQNAQRNAKLRDFINEPYIDPNQMPVIDAGTAKYKEKNNPDLPTIRW
jgi:hypothetical protein